MDINPSAERHVQKRTKGVKDPTRSTLGKMKRAKERVKFGKTRFYQEKGAFAKTHHTKHLTEEDMAVDVIMNRADVDEKTIDEKLANVLIQLRKFSLTLPLGTFYNDVSEK